MCNPAVFSQTAWINLGAIVLMLNFWKIIREIPTDSLGNSWNDLSKTFKPEMLKSWSSAHEIGITV